MKITQKMIAVFLTIVTALVLTGCSKETQSEAMQEKRVEVVEEASSGQSKSVDVDGKVIFVTNKEVVIDKDSDSIVLEKGTELIADFSKPYESFTTKTEGIVKYFLGGEHKGTFIDTITGTEYLLKLSDLVQKEKTDLFNESLLTKFYKPSKYLISEYFADVLQSGERDTVRQYEKNFIERIGEGNEYDDPWWVYEIVHPAIITQSYILLESIMGAFFVENVEKIHGGYKISVYSNRDTVVGSNEQYIYFQFDGDYVDIYEDNLENKIATYVYVSPEFYEGVRKVIAENVPVDVTNIIWPRRADGSSDYDDKIMERQEIPERIIDPLDDTYLLIDENTTVVQLEDAKTKLGEESFKKVINNINLNYDPAPNYYYDYYKTALSTALSVNKKKDVIEYLIMSGADVNTRIHDIAWSNAEVTTTPLNLALDLGFDIDIISLLLEAGADVNAKHYYGSTALFYAPTVEIAQLLIDYGARVHEKNDRGISALFYAQTGEIVQLLTGYGLDVNEMTTDEYSKMTPLMANYDGSIAVISAFLNAGARLDTIYNIKHQQPTVTESARLNKPENYERIFLPLQKMGYTTTVSSIIWHEIGDVYKITDKLRLRNSEGTSGEALLTLANNTAVRVREIGTLEKIDGLIAFWLQVEVAEDTTDTAGNKVAKGTTGWLFGGYVSMEKEGL